MAHRRSGLSSPPREHMRAVVAEAHDTKVLARSVLRQARRGACKGAGDSLINMFESLAVARRESQHSGLSPTVRGQVLRRAERWAHAARKAFFARCLIR